MKFNSALLPLFALPVVLNGCVGVGEHRQNVRNSSEEKLTLGVAQREIKAGMSPADVAKVLGSPNMVTRDKDGVETWIYDKVSTEYAYSSSSGGVSALILSAGSSTAGGLMGGGNQAAGASSRTQRTLTIIIKFKNSAVSEFTYNATSF